MPKIDIPIKRLMQIRIHDWIEFLIPNCNKDWIKEMDASKVPAKKESRLDKLILIDSPEERFILNIEPQGYLDYTMSARMLRYRSDIWEYTLAEGLGNPSLHADLLAVMSILVGEKFTSELVKKYVRRSMLMNSPIYNEWVAEELKEESLLDELFRKAITIPSLEDFEVLLSKVLKMQE